MRVRMVMVTILCVSVFFIALNLLLAKRMNITYLLFLNLFLWSLLHLSINRLISRNRERREREEASGKKF